MSDWYCEEHRHLNKSPNRAITLYEGKICCVKGCKNQLKLKLGDKR